MATCATSFFSTGMWKRCRRSDNPRAVQLLKRRSIAFKLLGQGYALLKSNGIPAPFLLVSLLT